MSNHIELFLLRHGRSRADDEDVIEGRYDSPLTEVGRAQALARGRELSAEGPHFDAVVASPLVRARESAEIIARELGLEVELDPGWMERDNGPVAGLSVEEAGRRYPLPPYLGPFDPLVPTARPGESCGESAWALQTRVLGALERVLRRGPGTYLVVGHGGSLSAALRGVVGAPPGGGKQGLRFSLGDLGYARIVYVPADDRWVFMEMRTGLGADFTGATV